MVKALISLSCDRNLTFSVDRRISVAQTMFGESVISPPAGQTGSLLTIESTMFFLYVVFQAVLGNYSNITGSK